MNPRPNRAGILIKYVIRKAQAAKCLIKEQSFHFGSGPVKRLWGRGGRQLFLFII